MESIDFINALNEQGKENDCLIFVEYVKTPEELLNDIEKLSNWIVQRNECDWCTLNGCIEIDSENITDFFRIILSDNILDSFSVLHRVKANRIIIKDFLKVLNKTIEIIDANQHDFLRHFKNYSPVFLQKIVNRFDYGIQINTLNKKNKQNPKINPQSNFEEKLQMKGIHSLFNAIHIFNIRIISTLNDFKNNTNQKMIEGKVQTEIIQSQKELKFLNCYEAALIDLEHFALSKKKHQIKNFKKIVDNRIEESELEITHLKTLFREHWLFGTNLFHAHGYFDLYNHFKSKYEKLFNSQKPTQDTISEKISLHPTEPETKKQKGYFNQLIDVQKEFISSLIEDGHQNSHIFHELKPSGIISLTEYEFRDFLNKCHNQNLDLEKRFTAKSNLSIPIELVRKCKEFRDKISKTSQ